MAEDAYKVVTCAYKYKGLDNESHRINPFDFIQNTKIKACKNALSRLLAKVDMSQIASLVDCIPEHLEALSIMPQIQKDFYVKLMAVRLDKLREMI